MNIWRSSNQPSLKTEWLGSDFLQPCPVKPWASQGWKSQNLSRTLCQCFTTCVVQKAFCYIPFPALKFHWQEQVTGRGKAAPRRCFLREEPANCCDSCSFSISYLCCYPMLHKKKITSKGHSEAFKCRMLLNKLSFYEFSWSCLSLCLPEEHLVSKTALCCYCSYFWLSVSWTFSLNSIFS